MAKIVEVVGWATANGPAIVTATVGVLTALIGLFCLIPGEQPEKALKSVVDFISKFSRK